MELKSNISKILQAHCGEVLRPQLLEELADEISTILPDQIMILQQDDCAPDSLESFEEKLKCYTGFSLGEFYEFRASTDGGFSWEFKIGCWTIEHSADDPFYTLYLNLPKGARAI